MAQSNIQIQEQVLRQQQVQRLSQQQMLQVRLLEMPLPQLEESVKSELDDNPALEVVIDDDPTFSSSQEQQEEALSSEQEHSEQEEREAQLEEALERIGIDDTMPETPMSARDTNNADYEEMVFGDTVSFVDKLKEQVGEHELTNMQHDIIEYLIGSLDTDGLLRKSIDSIADELAIHYNIYTTEEEIKQTLLVLQSFDPPGIGAQTLQECLLLQIERKTDGEMKTMMKKVVTHHFSEMMKNHWLKIQESLRLDDEQVAVVRQEIKRLNPKPGAAMGETQGRNIYQITPDFIVDTDDNGHVTFTLNRGQLPELHVSPAFTETLKMYQEHKDTMSRQEKEGLLYAKEKVDKAKGFIEAIKQRRHTMYVTMKAIIKLQHRYFAEGDESELKPMILQDVADLTGLDKSTISRVSNQKYAQTPWGTFKLRHFFSDSYTTGDGQELSTKQIKQALRDVVDHEDKRHPLSDEALTAKMKEKGFPIARRTVAKYREQLHIPKASMRKA